MRQNEDRAIKMKMSKRAKRMERNHGRNKQAPLNLVALMDIFTILVFFLLVSSSNVQQLPNNKDVKLPTSIAKKVPKETLVITITKNNILVQGRAIIDIEKAINMETIVIPELKNELMFQASKSISYKSMKRESRGRPVTIMGDENITYELLRKVLSTCRQANYTLIAFSAIQKSRDKV